MAQNEFSQQFLQEQKMVQQQRFSLQQVQFVRLLEMPLTAVEQSVKAEIDDNPALDAEQSEEVVNFTPGAEDDYLRKTYRKQTQTTSFMERAVDEDETFQDTLTEQINMLYLTEKERQLMDYVVGSLDNDGLLRKSALIIAEELVIYQGIDTTAGEIQTIIDKLKKLDPAGIGAKDLQECLLIQIDRKKQSVVKAVMHRIISKYYDDFIHKHWDRISKRINEDSDVVEQAFAEIQRLNPRPGAALGESLNDHTQQITPDFIVETSDDGKIVFTLNKGRVPHLRVSEDFVEMINNYEETGKKHTKQEEDAYIYAKERVERAKNYVNIVQLRYATLTSTMKAIIEWQREYFLSGDETDIKPMILKDIAEKTKLDISTISRVSNQKYVQTDWGIFPLRHFFSVGHSTGEGEEMATRKIKLALKEVVEKEDKKHPLSDEKIASILNEKGFPIARRTVAKYREKMSIPPARLRK